LVLRLVKSRGRLLINGAKMSRGSPSPADFDLHLERDGRGTVVLVLAGELDLFRAPAVEEAMARATAPPPPDEATFEGRSGDDREVPGKEVRRLVVDLRSVTFIDSSTLFLLLAASRRQRACGGEFLVLVGPQTPMSAFEVTGFDRLLAISRVVKDVHGKGTP
jgi:anti-anti-sigma regulatory factor